MYGVARWDFKVLQMRQSVSSTGRWGQTREEQCLPSVCLVASLRGQLLPCPAEALDDQGLSPGLGIGLEMSLGLPLYTVIPTTSAAFLSAPGDAHGGRRHGEPPLPPPHTYSVEGSWVAELHN